MLDLLGLCLILGLLLGVVSITVNKQVAGLLTTNSSQTLSDNIGVSANPSVPAAQPSSLTTRSTNTTGTLTMTNASHGLTTGQRVDLYWSGGQAYGAVLGTVSGVSAPIASVSGGTALPAQSTAITVGIATSAPFNVVGNNMKALVLTAPQAGYYVFNNGSDLNAAYVQAGNPFTWTNTDVAANPLAGDTPTLVYMSHSSVSAAVTGMAAAAVSH